VLTEGDAAPDFTLLDQQRQPVALSDFRGRKVLLYFYPRAATPGCTAQSCGLRDMAGQIGDTVIVGVGSDDPEHQLSFDQKYHSTSRAASSGPGTGSAPWRLPSFCCWRSRAADHRRARPLRRPVTRCGGAPPASAVQTAERGEDESDDPDHRSLLDLTPFNGCDGDRVHEPPGTTPDACALSLSTPGTQSTTLLARQAATVSSY
jgi:hypothetical protein